MSRGRVLRIPLMPTPAILEIPVDDAATARVAARYADRLEICRDLASEGLTPSPKSVTEIVDAARSEGRNPEIAVLFQERPPPSDRREVRASDFMARPEDLARLESLVPAFAEAGAGSIVVGFLESDGSPDPRAVGTAVGIAASSGLGTAFHRAFDFAEDPALAIRTLFGLGVRSTLAAGSSGYDASIAAIEDRVTRLERAASAVPAGSFSVVPCGGIRSNNVAAFARATPHAHASCRRRPSPFELGGFDEREAMALRRRVHPDAGDSGPG